MLFNLETQAVLVAAAAALNDSSCGKARFLRIRILHIQVNFHSIIIIILCILLAFKLGMIPILSCKAFNKRKFVHVAI